MKPLPFQDEASARAGFQYLEDLATAYWYSEVFFAALERKLFDHLGNGASDLDTLAHATCCDPTVLSRLLTALQKLALVGESGGKWFNRPAADRYLVTTVPAYLGDFLLYRQYMKTGWGTLLNRLSGSRPPLSETTAPENDYTLRNFRYVKVMDALAREKACDIANIIPDESWRPPILDIGGGAGALCRTMIRSKPHGKAHLFDLPEVIQAAQEIYPDSADWHRINTHCGDFRTHRFPENQQFGLILMGNFLHVYGPTEARKLLEKAASLLSPAGLLVVHDYFPDMGERSPQKGALYDLAMLLNTYDGACHSAKAVAEWLKAAGMVTVIRQDLSTDSSLIMASGPQGKLSRQPSAGGAQA